jgi:hypothetical protein
MLLFVLVLKCSTTPMLARKVFKNILMLCDLRTVRMVCVQVAQDVAAMV